MDIRFRGFSGALLVCALAGAVALGGCKAKDDKVVVAPGTPGPTTTTVVTSPPPPNPGQEVAGVKAMITDVKNVKDVKGMSEIFTNESAAAMGVMMLPIMQMFASMGDMGNQMGRRGQGQVPPNVASLKPDLEAIKTKYGLKQSISMGDREAIATAAPRGRELFADVMTTMEKVGGKGKSGFDMSGSKAPNPEDATYEVISPTRVKITPKNPKSGQMENMEARWEDGRWRLHLDVDAMLKQATSGMGGGGMPGGGPPGGGPPMGAGTPR